MDNSRRLTADQILERISTGNALHHALQALSEEVQGFRADINQLRQEMAGPSPTRYLSTAEAAELFGVSEATVRKRVNDKTWPAWRDGRQIRFGPSDVEAIREWGQPKPQPAPLTPLERRQRNKRIRSLSIG